MGAQHYTRDEDLVLLSLWRDGLTDAEIARRLPRRNAVSVKFRRYELARMLRRKMRKSPWTEDDARMLEVLFRVGQSDTEIAVALGRTADAIGLKRREIGLHRYSVRK